MNDREHQKTKWRERKKAGLCARCGKRPPFEHYAQCAECLYKDNTWPRTTTDSQSRKERLKELRAERRAAGLCITCGKPVYKGHSRCYECYLRNNRLSAEYRARHKTDKPRHQNPPPPVQHPSTDHPWNLMNRLIKNPEKKEE